MLLVSGSTKSVGRLAASHPDTLGHLITPANRNGVASLLCTGLRWAADNGAFAGFDPKGFRRMLRRVAGHPRLLWVVCPDAVGDAKGTLALWRQWEPEVRAAGVPVAFVLQDGQELLEMPAADCYFIGGSTEFKLSHAAADLAAEGKRRGAWVHMGRVNSRRRMEYAYRVGCDSVDGSSASMFGDKYIHKYLQWIRQIGEQGVLF